MNFFLKKKKFQEKLNEIYFRLFHKCQQVFLRQLTSWLVFGILNDPYQEFFIRPFINDKEKSKEEYSGNLLLTTEKKLILFFFFFFFIFIFSFFFELNQN